MISRRRFIKISGILSIVFSLLPQLFVRNTPAACTKKHAGDSRLWLEGLPKRGCSTSHLLSSDSASLENCLNDVHSLADFC